MKKRKRWKQTKSLLKMKSKYIFRFFIVLLVVGVAWLISSRYYQLMMVQGDSMLPAYRNMQLVVLDKHSEDYVYGDVVAFHCEELNSILVKRIVACPGDKVVIENGTLCVNGETSRVFPLKGVFEYSGLAENGLQLAADYYFVIGDNIEKSKDSRYEEVGCVRRDYIIGEVMILKEGQKDEELY